MNVFQCIRDAITKTEDFWNWCGHPFGGDKSCTCQPRQNVEQAPTQEKTPTGEKSTENWADDVILPGVCPDSQPPPSNSRQSIEKEKYSVKWWKERLEIVGIITGVVVAVVICLQYGQMVIATTAAKDAAVANRGQMEIMSRQLNDSEAQQRAWLRVERMDVQRITNSMPFPFNFNFPQSQLAPGMHLVAVSTILKNYGSTPAVDLGGTGLSDSERANQLYEEKGLTNLIPKRWSWGTSEPVPQPGNSGLGVMPGETFTNPVTITQVSDGDSVYFEAWISYRTIFGQTGIVGEGGTYFSTNDAFSPAFIHWEQVGHQGQTNQNK